MPSLDKRQRKKQRVQDSDGDDAASSGGDDHELGTQARRNDAILAKVDPEYLNSPVDLRQGESKLRILAGQLTAVKKKVQATIGSLSEVAGDWAETLSEDHRDDEYDEERMIAALLADVRRLVLCLVAFCLACAPRARARKSLFAARLDRRSLALSLS